MELNVEKAVFYGIELRGCKSKLDCILLVIFTFNSSTKLISFKKLNGLKDQ